MIKAIFIMKEEILEEMTKKMDLIFGKTNSSDSSVSKLAKK